MDDVALGQKQFRKVRAVLPGDSCDESGTGQDAIASEVAANRSLASPSWAGRSVPVGSRPV